MCALAVFAAIPAPVSAQTPAPREYQIKAVFIFNFIQFVIWPPESFESPDSPIRIGILGQDPFGGALDEAVRGETIRNHPLIIKRSDRADDLLDCHLVFIARSEERRLGSILARLNTRPVLTVSDSDDFTRHGGIIGFYTENRKVRFEINVGTAQQADLKLSSQLLSLGRLVGTQSINER